jgi:hypothetical protein
LSPSKVKVSPTKRAVGLCATLNRRSPFSEPSSDDDAALRVVRSRVMSALPVLAARSMTTLPSFGLYPAALRRGVHVKRLERDDGVPRVDVERDRLGGDAGNGGGEHRGDEGLAHGISCSWFWTKGGRGP